MDLKAPIPKYPRDFITSVILITLEIICGVLLLFGLYYMFQPSWSENKLTALQAELAAAKPKGPEVEGTKPISDSTSTQEVAINAVATETESPKNEPTVTPTELPPTEEPTKEPTAEATKATDASAFSPELQAALKTVFAILPTSAPRDKGQTPPPQLVELGRMLYFDPRLSMSGTLSCNDCHNLDTYGVDNLPLSLGITGSPVARNSPSVYNAAIHIAQFWDGRSPDVEDQATKPIMAAGEMGMVDEAAVKANISAIEVYQNLFAEAFPEEKEPITLKNIGIAIGAFERGLLTPSRFDQFLGGKEEALNEQELRGLNTFVSLRCVTCHMGASIGGTLYKKLGVIEPYETEDLGRFEITKAEEDKYVFKVPSLRNVAKTAPYLHDGSIATLEEMVPLMARHQLGKTVSDEQIADIVAFLNTLTGELPAEYIEKPALPQ